MMMLFAHKAEMLTDLRTVKAASGSLASMLVSHQFPIKYKRFIHNAYVQTSLSAWIAQAFF